MKENHRSLAEALSKKLGELYYPLGMRQKKVWGFNGRRLNLEKLDQIVVNILANPIPGEDWNLEEINIKTYKRVMADLQKSRKSDKVEELADLKEQYENC